jgi:hypothetical protein
MTLGSLSNRAEATTIPQGVERHASRDAEQPRAEPGPRCERTSMTVDPKEDILTQVFGQVMVAKEGEQVAVDAAAIKPVHFFECGCFLPADSQDQFGVTVAAKQEGGGRLSDRPPPENISNQCKRLRSYPRSRIPAAATARDLRPADQDSQLPKEQNSCDWHECWHAPQLFASHKTSMHCPTHNAVPNPQSLHTPWLQYGVGSAHAFPQTPQLSGSESRKVQVPLQSSAPGAQS